MSIPLYRNIRARDQLDIFLISAISSLLAVRLYLEVTGYPQIGSGGLHIAHMLWGGFLMMIGTVVMLSFIGYKAQQLGALLSGVGFGVFIDELGKFITNDNDYFFEPTIGILYAIFVIMYLSFNFLTRDQKLTSREYQMNALFELEQLVAYDLDAGEKRQVKALLAKADQRSHITKDLSALIDKASLSAHETPGFLHRWARTIDSLYIKFWDQKRSNTIAKAVFGLTTIAIFLTIIATSYSNVIDIKYLFDTQINYGEELIIGQFITSIIAGLLILYGFVLLKDSRQAAFEQFRRSTLITIYLTEFFVFSRIQFEALPGLVTNIALLIIIGFVLRQERRLAE